MEDTRPAAMQTGNPLRHPDWRWRRAKAVVARNGRCSPRKDDAVTILLAAYLREAARCRSARQRDRLAVRRPGLGEAIELRETGGLRRAEVEARILAGQTDDEIALAVDVSAAGVSWYEQAFFDVRVRLGARDWITWRAIGQARRPMGACPGPVLKAAGYHGGLVLLEVVLAVVCGKPFPAHQLPQQQAGRSYVEARRRLLVCQLIAEMQATTPAELAGLIKTLREAATIDQAQRHVPPVIRPPDRTWEMLEQAVAGPGRPKPGSRKTTGGSDLKTIPTPLRFFESFSINL